MAKMMNQVGVIAGGIGFLVAIVLGLLIGLGAMAEPAFLASMLIVIGLFVGALNITIKERVPFVVGVLGIGAGAGIVSLTPIVGGVFEAILQYISLIALPAGVVVGVALVFMGRK